MGLSADLAQFSAKLDAAVQAVVETRIFRAAQVNIAIAVEKCVYEAYTPGGKHPYERRRSEGGLQDPRNIVMVGGKATVTKTPGITTIELEVQDIAKDQDNLPVAEIIESGEGYHWENSRIYKWEHEGRPLARPFHEEAEKMLIEDGSVEAALRSGLNALGFTVI